MMERSFNNPTPYPEVNRVLWRLLEGARSILGEEFVGLYLYGSLASGDFHPQRSDIDFVIVTRNLLPQAKIDALEEMHKGFASSSDKWDRKLEGLYMPLAELRAYDAHGPELPSVNEGRFYMARQGSDWVIQRQTLRAHETIVSGPSIREFIDPVTPDQIRTAVCMIMHEWWAPMIDDPAWLDGRPEYQAYTVQSMCRVLYTLEFATTVSKTRAAQWALETVDEEWVELVTDAAGWPDTWPRDITQVQAFIRFTLERCEALSIE
jgi:hypothetical protein